MMMDESQVKSQSDSPQDSAGQTVKEMSYSSEGDFCDNDDASSHLVQERKRDRHVLILMALFIAAVIIGCIALVQQSGKGDAPLSGNERQNEPSRIIGGSQSYQNEFPYYVDTGDCGGALIAPKIVLSAAHCGTSKFSGNKVIVNGSKRGKAGTYGKLISWSRWVPHPGFAEAGRIGPINDFALYLLDEAVTGLPVSLSLNQDRSFPVDGSTVVALGTGVQNRGSQLVKGRDLHDVMLPVINAEECKDNLGSFFNTDVMMCAGATGRGICYGDSGGPLVVRNGNRHILVGVTSFLGNPQCAKFHKYDNVFARTSSAFHWIKSVVCDQWGEQADFCPGNPGATCTDKPGWTDRDGYNCQAYIYTEATGVPICEYHRDIPGAGGLTPVQACCVCNPNSHIKPAPTAGSCSDSLGWTDSNGYDCQAYVYTEATGVTICEYHRDIPGAGGLTPVQACCVCNYSTGQGSNANSPTNPTSSAGSCSDSPGWTDSNGYDCGAYASTEATGVPICEYHRDIPGAGGLTPVQACCTCK